MVGVDEFRLYRVIERLGERGNSDRSRRKGGAPTPTSRMMPMIANWQNRLQGGANEINYRRLQLRANVIPV